MIAPAEFWDKQAADYAKSPIKDTAAYEYTLERTRAYLSATDSVLELGSGTGTTALKLASYVNEITATDISGEMVAIGQRKAVDQNISNAQFERADMSALPDPQHPYDAILAFNALHMIQDLDATLAQIHARLKPGGIFISKTFAARGQSIPLKMRALLWALPIAQRLGKAPFARR